MLLDPMTDSTGPDALDRQFAEAADRLLLFIRLRLGPALAARVDELDVLQEVYLSARRSWARRRRRDDEPLLPWLCSVAANRLADLGRARNREIVIPARQGGDGPGLSGVLELARDDRTGPLTAAVRVDARRALAEAIDGLDEESREVLLAHFFEGKSQAQIAADSGRSSSAVQRTLTAALVAVGRPLRAAFGEGGER